MLEEKLDNGIIMECIEWAYEQANTGFIGMDSAIDLAEEFRKDNETIIEAVDSIIRWQIAKAGTAGFVTGLGGIITLPLSLPANITSIAILQLRMIAAIAHLGGYNVKDEKVKSLVFLCLAGSSAVDILKDIGIVLGKKLTIQVIKNISGKTITAINQKVGFRLFTKFGEKGLVNLGKAIPLIGGVIGGAVDSITTNTVGNIAKSIFIDIKE